MSQLVANIQAVQGRIQAACERAGRTPAEVTLIAVSKTMPADLVLEAVAAGITHLGENRVEEAQLKIPQVQAHSPQALTWHMIGHIQSRKAKDIPAWFQRVHSVDTLKLATKLAQRAGELGQVLPVLLEVNISGEAQKSGFSASAWQTDTALRQALWKDVQAIVALPQLRVEGLMTMAPFYADAEATRPVFRSLAALRLAMQEALGIALPQLSMGMTNDYEVAIEEGATFVRVGRAIFGERA